jgi:hypothetical protein
MPSWMPDSRPKRQPLAGRPRGRSPYRLTQLRALAI